MKPGMLKLIAVAFALVFSFATAHAQSFVVSVPFDFHVGTKQMPAGDYTVTTAYNPVRVTIMGSKAGAIAVRRYNLDSEHPAQEQSRLVFFRLHNQYYLSQIWSPELQNGLSVQLPKSILMAEHIRSVSEETIIAATHI
jgi:hypothetical protein